MKATTKKYNLVVMCEKDKELVYVNEVGPSFNCPNCKAALVFDVKNRKLGGHGKTDKTVGHQLRSTTEL